MHPLALVIVAQAMLFALTHSHSYKTAGILRIIKPHQYAVVGICVCPNWPVLSHVRGKHAMSDDDLLDDKIGTRYVSVQFKMTVCYCQRHIVYDYACIPLQN